MFSASYQVFGEQLLQSAYSIAPVPKAYSIFLYLRTILSQASSMDSPRNSTSLGAKVRLRNFNLTAAQGAAEEFSPHRGPGCV